MRANKKISLGLALALTLSLTTPALAAPAPAPQATPKVVCYANGRSPFSDVPSTHGGDMTGTYHNPSTGERQFSPAAPLTMAEWTVMIYRAWYADEPYAVAQESWWNREAEVLNRHGKGVFRRFQFLLHLRQCGIDAVLFCFSHHSRHLPTTMQP